MNISLLVYRVFRSCLGTLFQTVEHRLVYKWAFGELFGFQKSFPDIYCNSQFVYILKSTKYVYQNNYFSNYSSTKHKKLQNKKKKFSKKFLAQTHINTPQLQKSQRQDSVSLSPPNGPSNLIDDDHIKNGLNSALSTDSYLWCHVF